MTTICIGGVCIPVYALIPLAFIFLDQAWSWFKKNVLGMSDTVVVEGSRVIHITTMEQYKELHQKAKDTKRSLVVDFTASWCGPCRFIAPVYAELSKKYPCTLFLKVDVDEMKQIAKGHGVSAMPTFQFFRNGTKCDELRGANQSGLEEKIQKHYVEVELPEEERPVTPEPVEGAEEGSSLRQRKTPQVVAIDSEEQWKELLITAQKRDQVVVVAFTASWNNAWQSIAPAFEELSMRYPKAVFAQVDVDAQEELMAAYEVETLPTFKLLKQGEVVQELTGGIKTALESIVAAHCS